MEYDQEAVAISQLLGIHPSYVAGALELVEKEPLTKENLTVALEKQLLPGAYRWYQSQHAAKLREWCGLPPAEQAHLKMERDNIAYLVSRGYSVTRTWGEKDGPR